MSETVYDRVRTVKTQIGGIEYGIGVDQLYATLRDLPDSILSYEKIVVGLDASLREKQERLGWLKERYEAAVLAASLDAPQDGKNAEQRKLQLEQYVATSDQVKAAKDAVIGCEQAIRMCLGNIDATKADLRKYQNMLKVTLAEAELKAALLRATG